MVKKFAEYVVARRLAVLWVGLSVAFTASNVAAAIILGPGGRTHSVNGWVHHAVAGGDWVAWGEFYGQGSLAAVYAYNVATGQTRPIVAPDPAFPDMPGGTAQIWGWAWWHAQIAISNETVVYTDARNYGHSPPLQLRAHNLNTGSDVVVSPSWFDQPGFAAMDGDRIVYQYGERWAYLTTLGSGSTTYFTGGSFPLPDISGDTVVWKNGNSVGSSIERLDLATGERAIVFQASHKQDPRNPSIDGNVIVWSMRDNTADDKSIVSIMAYNLATGQLTTILEHTGSLEHRSMVAVSGGVVVWEDWRAGNRDIYGYDMATGQEFPVATGRGDQRGPSIDGDLITWSDNYWDIGWTRFTRTPEPATAMVVLIAMPILLRRQRTR